MVIVMIVLMMKVVMEMMNMSAAFRGCIRALWAGVTSSGPEILGKVASGLQDEMWPVMFSSGLGPGSSLEEYGQDVQVLVVLGAIED